MKERIEREERERERKRDKDNGDEALLKPSLALAASGQPVMRAKPRDPRSRNSGTRKHCRIIVQFLVRTSIVLQVNMT